MITTTNLGLTVWDSEKDDFEHSELANNFVRIDGHNHEGGLSQPLSPPGPRGETSGHWTSLGLGLGIGTFSIVPGAIWRYLIANRAVGHSQIDIGGVESENIAALNVLNEHIDDEAVNDRTIAAATVTIDKLDPDILKLGTVLLWYKATPGEQPGDIWEVLDGRAWSEVPNVWGLKEGHLPDLRERFARGTDLAHTGETGGAPFANLAHQHHFEAAAINHSHVVTAHNHVIVPDGIHNHTFEGGHSLRTRQNAFAAGLGLVVNGEANLSESHYAAGLQNHDEKLTAPYDWSANMDQGGVHSHGGATGLSSAFSTSGSSLGGTITTDTQLAEVSTSPPYVGLAYIMRVR